MTEIRAVAKTLLMVLAFLLIAVAHAYAQADHPPQTTTVILVRHAEKADGSRDPVLSAQGAARAQDLADALADAAVTAIYVTEFARTQLTAAPLAQRLGLAAQVRPVAGRSVDEEANAMAAHIRATHPGETVLVVGHSNTVPAMAAALGAPRMPDLADAEYSTMFVLEVTPGGTRLIRGRFGAGDAATQRQVD
ncbi:MAG: phosphoglycerate mutase family protein [Gemmatimonadota bacterium]